MLSRYARIDPETGIYYKPENPNVVYGSLTYVWLTY
jgi:acyl-CoA oxidase